jgi:hypothetical protein
MNFKDYYMLTESKKDKPSYCLMAYLTDESIDKVAKLGKKLNLRARELVTPKKYHTTINYFETENDVKLFIEFLQNFKFKNVSAQGKKLDFLGDSYSLFLNSKELSSVFNKTQDWLIKHDFPKSIYPKYLPHLAFCYDPHKSWIPPEIDEKDCELDLIYDNFKLSKDHETIWRLK